MPDACFLVATLNRPAGLRRVLESIRATAPRELAVMVARDEDDPGAEVIAAAYGADCVTCPESRKGPANAWNTALAAAPNHWLYILAADDSIFQPGWYEAALRALAKIGNSGMVGFHDGRKLDGKIITHYMLTRDFMIHYQGGVMCCPYYRTVGPDTETTEIARKANKFIWAEDARVTHDWHGDDYKADETYRQARAYTQQSKAMYKQRKDAGFPITWEAIIK